MARSERPMTHSIFQAIEAGELSLTGIKDKNPLTFKDRVVVLGNIGRLKKEHARCLHLVTRFVEVAGEPAPQRDPGIRALEDAIRNETRGPVGAATAVLPAASKLDETARRGQAILRCTATALALERFRLASGRWPASLTEVVPGYLRQVPTDPFDGQPVRLVRFGDRVAIYSVGPDGQDNGGLFDRTAPLVNGIDLGVCLWDLRHRRQPPDAGVQRNR
jgi:hypothetical protein